MSPNFLGYTLIPICQKADYSSHSRPLFYQLKTLNVHDIVNFKCMVFMYKIYNKLLPANVMSYFKTINACHNHNVCMKTRNFKIKFSRTTKKSECISVKGPKMWNEMPAYIKVCKSMFTFKKMYKALVEKLLPFKSLFLLVNTSFRRRHVSFVYSDLQRNSTW